MAEPYNTPMPASTPVPASTPRSTSPEPAPPDREATPVGNAATDHRPRAKPIVLHIGDPVQYNPGTYANFSNEFAVIRPSLEERQRPAFIQALQSQKWGAFSAIFRPFWGSGGEMGRWDDDLIALLPTSCKVFASAGAGFDWVDTEALGRRGIIYCNSGMAAAEAVADFAVAMVISTFRQLPWCTGMAALSVSSVSDETRQQYFRACHSLATATSHNPRGHILGIIGFGNIGQTLAAKLGCAAFGMKIHYFDLLQKPYSIEMKLDATFHASLESLLEVADCVVLCTPAATDGRPLMTKNAFAATKPGARFVNIARGSLVDEDALADALEMGRLSNAALDVHSDEPRVHPRLLQLATPTLPATVPDDADSAPTPARVMLTCHNAGGTVETHTGFEELSMQNITAVLRGLQPTTPVNLHHLL